MPKWVKTRSFQVFGTGDVDFPKPSVRQLEESKAEEIAEMVFRSKLSTPKQIAKLAETLRCEPWQIESLKVSPAVQKALEMRVRALAMERMPAIIEAQAKKAEDDVQAATFVAKAADVLKGGAGVTVNTAVGVDNRRNGGDADQVIAFNQRFRERQLAGIHRKLEITDGSDSGG